MRGRSLSATCRSKTRRITSALTTCFASPRSCNSGSPSKKGNRTKMKKIMEFFGFTSAGAFMKEWKALDETDQAQLKAGIEDGSLTY